MIYRGKFRKDGALASVDVVESELQDGERVFYVEAGTKSEAVTKLKSKFVAERRAARKANGVCWDCPALVKPGHIRCTPCLGKIRIHNLGLREDKRAMADVRWDNGDVANGAELGALRQVLRAYDRDPAGFREWLLRMLGREQSQAAE